MDTKAIEEALEKAIKSNSVKLIPLVTSEHTHCSVALMWFQAPLEDTICKILRVRVVDLHTLKESHITLTYDELCALVVKLSAIERVMVKNAPIIEEQVQQFREQIQEQRQAADFMQSIMPGSKWPTGSEEMN